MKIAVLCGGISEEREVSLKTGAAVVRVLEELGHDVLEMDPGQSSFVEKLQRNRPDFAFIALHGKGGEDGTMQALLEFLGIPYNGSGPLASAMAFHKGVAKRIFVAEGIPTADYIEIRAEKELDVDNILQTVLKKLSLPLVVKPARQGSTIGVTIARTVDQLRSGIQAALAFDSELVIEKFIPGTEVTVSLLGNDKVQVLPLIEIVSEKGIYDYEAKYTPGMSHHIIPPRLSPEQVQRASEIALSAHKALGCAGLSRSEVIVNAEGAYILEVNTLPGMTATSLFPDAAKAAGIPFNKLVESLITLGLESYSRKAPLVSIG